MARRRALDCPHRESRYTTLNSDEIAQLKREISELRREAKSRAWLPVAVAVLAVVAGFQGVMSALWTWNVRVLERQRVPYLEERVLALEPPVQSWSRWLVARQRDFEGLLEREQVLDASRSTIEAKAIPTRIQPQKQPQ